ncbi:ABC transporter permease [Thermomicrobiaceae bacterium CFH 74404]|uniref:ABC transporter permease n=1 Tax=Thermalbibacter longus TaxID=2951981 RepID=A0AA41WG38_9BACT|nr:ABC transporter permease [Thermalbibacter longus]MCM8749949.1 ABC transporter permease [Thermalbibacter longus]
MADIRSCTVETRLASFEVRQEPPAYRRYLRSLRTNLPALVGLFVLIGIGIASVAAPLLAPHDPAVQDIARRLVPPAWSTGGDPRYLLGTDALGRDVLSRIIYGSRISLAVGILAVTVQGCIGVALGLLAGYYGKRVDSIIMRIADLQYALPSLILAIAIMAVLGPSLRNVILVIGITGWVYYARIVRGEVLALREQEFVVASRAIGCHSLRILLRHILPNVTSSIVVVASLQVARAIITEASLSFLGLGVPPSIPTWGGMVSEGRQYVATAWWISGISGAAIFITVMAINLVGDWIRDELDPASKRARQVSTS